MEKEIINCCFIRTNKTIYLPTIDYSGGKECRKCMKWWDYMIKKHDNKYGHIIRSNNGNESYEWWSYYGKHREEGLPAVIRNNGKKEWWFFGVNVTEETALFFNKMKMKRVKKVFRKWYDITYQVGKKGFKNRMLRDIKLLENDIGYKLIKNLKIQ